MSLLLYDHSRSIYVEVPVTPHTTFRDVIERCQPFPGQKCHVVEIYNDLEERIVDPREKPLNVMKEDKNNSKCQFVLYNDKTEARGPIRPHNTPKRTTLSNLANFVSHHDRIMEQQNKKVASMEDRLKVLKKEEIGKRRREGGGVLMTLLQKVEVQEKKINQLRHEKGLSSNNSCMDKKKGIPTLEELRQAFRMTDKELNSMRRRVAGLMEKFDEHKNMNSHFDLEMLKNSIVELNIQNCLKENLNLEISDQENYLKKRKESVPDIQSKVEDLRSRLNLNKDKMTKASQLVVTAGLFLTPKRPSTLAGAVRTRPNSAIDILMGKSKACSGVRRSTIPSSSANESLLPSSSAHVSRLPPSSSAHVSRLPPSSSAHVSLLPPSSSAHISRLPSSSSAHVSLLPSSSAHESLLPSSSSAHVSLLPPSSSAHISRLTSSSSSSAHVSLIPSSSTSSAHVSLIPSSSTSSAHVSLIPSSSTSSAHVSLIPSSSTSSAHVSLLPSSSIVHPAPLSSLSSNEILKSSIPFTSKRRQRSTTNVQLVSSSDNNDVSDTVDGTVNKTALADYRMTIVKPNTFSKKHSDLNDDDSIIPLNRSSKSCGFISYAKKKVEDLKKSQTNFTITKTEVNNGTVNEFVNPVKKVFYNSSIQTPNTIKASTDNNSIVDNQLNIPTINSPNEIIEEIPDAVVDDDEKDPFITTSLSSPREKEMNELLQLTSPSSNDTTWMSNSLIQVTPMSTLTDDDTEEPGSIDDLNLTDLSDQMHQLSPENKSLTVEYKRPKVVSTNVLSDAASELVQRNESLLEQSKEDSFFSISIPCIVSEEERNRTDYYKPANEHSIIKDDLTNDVFMNSPLHNQHPEVSVSEFLEQLDGSSSILRHPSVGVRSLRKRLSSGSDDLHHSCTSPRPSSISLPVVVADVEPERKRNSYDFDVAPFKFKPLIHAQKHFFDDITEAPHEYSNVSLVAGQKEESPGVINVAEDDKMTLQVIERVSPDLENNDDDDDDSNDDEDVVLKEKINSEEMTRMEKTESEFLKVTVDVESDSESSLEKFVSSSSILGGETMSQGGGDDDDISRNICDDRDDGDDTSSDSSDEDCAVKRNEGGNEKDDHDSSSSFSPLIDTYVGYFTENIGAVGDDGPVNKDESKSNFGTSAAVTVVQTSNSSSPANTKSILKKSGSKNSSKRRSVVFSPLAILLDAALQGELDVVMDIVEKKGHFNMANDEGITALHNSICAGQADVAHYLVRSGCDVNAADSDLWTPLHCAASCYNLGLVQLLVENGACLFATTESEGETALEKCDDDEEDGRECKKYLEDVQRKMLTAGSELYAAYDHDPNHPDELQFIEGDVLVVLDQRYSEKEDKKLMESDENNGGVSSNDPVEGWLMARNKRNSLKGYVPKNYLAMYPRVVLA